jgi:hypothetical protein
MLFVDIIAVRWIEHEHTYSVWANFMAVDDKVVCKQPIITPQQGIKSR